MMTKRESIFGHRRVVDGVGWDSMHDALLSYPLDFIWVGGCSKKNQSGGTNVMLN